MFLILNSGWLSNKAAKKATPKNQQYLGTLFVSIGLCFFVFVEIPETGASLNPFRSLAPVIFQSWGSQGEVGWAYMWIYFAAPILGGLLAAIINRRIHKINLYPVC
jgi:glycerol uptake facilitator-like aquaporin